jgi:hypothetical protein
MFLIETARSENGGTPGGCSVAGGGKFAKGAVTGAFGYMVVRPAAPNTGCAVRTSDPNRDDFNSDYFSSGDRTSQSIRAAIYPGYKAHLGTPSGQFKWFDTRTQRAGVLE